MSVQTESERVNIYVVRVNGYDEEKGGQHSSELWGRGLFKSEAEVQAEVDGLNEHEGRAFGPDSGLFYDWWMYTFLSEGDIPY